MSDGLCECGCGETPRLAPYNSASRGWRIGEPVRFIKGHQFHRNRKSQIPYIEDPDTDCWLWQRTKNERGYGALRVAGRGMVRAHRYFYEQAIGPIPEGLELDHLCRNRACVNPGHLEAVTHRENIVRGHAARLAEAA